MRKIYTFTDFLNEAKEPQDLNKIYLAYNPDLGHRFWSYKDFAADKFFIRLTFSTVDKLLLKSIVCNLKTILN